MSIKDEFGKLLSESAARLGRGLSDSTENIKAYAEERMLHLSTIIDEPGYAEVLLAERDNVALRAGMAAVDAADAADAELRGAILGALAIGARALL